MSNTQAEVESFFSRYEQANKSFHFEQVAACYADVFLFASSAGVQCVKNEDFLKVIPRRKEFFQSQGWRSSRISSIESSPLDGKYTLAKVIWNMSFDRGTSEPMRIEVATSYLLWQTEVGWQITVQIDHQDVAAPLQALPAPQSNVP